MADVAAVIAEQVDYLIAHIESGHGDPACRICTRAEALRLIALVPFEVTVYKKHTGSKWKRK